MFDKFGSIQQVGYASSGIREDSVACRRYKHAFGALFMGTNRFCYFSRVAETVEDVREVCSRAGSFLGRTVLLKTNSQFVQQAHRVIM